MKPEEAQKIVYELQAIASEIGFYKASGENLPEILKDRAKRAYKRSKEAIEILEQTAKEQGK
jgi:chaperonin cofactor prefoldin